VLNQKASLLSLDEIRRIVENCPDLKNVVLSGGEPFLRDDIDQLCRILIKSGNPVITIPTNGSLPEKMYAKVKEILAQDCKKLVVSLSLDGAKDFHDDNRGIPGLFAKVLESYAKLEALKGIYGDRLVIQVNTCVSKDNLDQIDALAELILAKFPRAEWMIEPVRGFFNERLVSPLNLDDWKGLNRKILEMDRRGVFLGRDADGIKRNYDYALRALESEKQPVPCCGGESFLYIDHEGKVYPCEFLPAVADLRKVDYDLNSLVAEKAWTECVEKIKNGDCYCTHFCWLSASVEKSEQRRSFVFAVKKFIAKHLD
jgi:MoaA/NifB/PqqE/SkfB family radical SAM enzyme